MKVCFLTERMLLGYGVDLFVDRVAQGLSQRGFEVTVCCNVHDETFLDHNYAIRCVPYERAIHSFSETERNATVALSSFIAGQDVLVACTFPYFRVASSSDKPWIAVDFGVVPPHFYRGRINWELRYHLRSHYQECFPKARSILCISEFLQSQLPRPSRERSRVIYPGIDHYPRSFLCDLKQLFGLSGPVILYAGRSTDLSPYKNTNSLLCSYRTIHEQRDDVQLVISTNCSHEEKARLERLGAIVLNGVTMEFVPSLYHSADIFATATEWEGFDLPLLEASYFGLPVVAYNVGAHPEIVKHGSTGFLASSEEQFLEYLLNLIKDKSLRTEIGSNGERFAETYFLWSKTVDAYAHVLDGFR